MAELSPAAQAVLAAVINDTADIINKPHCDWIQGYSRQIAAALRAAALYSYCPVDRRILATIATELENYQ